MAIPASSVWKLEDDSTFSVNCFPARGMSRTTHEGGGSWIVAYAHEQQRRYKSSYKPPRKDLNRFLNEATHDPIDEESTIPTVVPNMNYANPLDEDALLNHHHVESPLDLCSINVSGCDLEFKEPKPNFSKFKNVAYINAAENLLALKPFDTFPNLRELELPVNALRGLDMRPGDFPTLQVLDLSYNNLSPADMLCLGFLPKLKVLTLTGNGLSQIHPDLCQPYSLKEGEEETYTRFQSLEVLLLDDNQLHDMATFAALAALPRLKELNLDKNDVTLVPYLKVIGERILSETHSHTRLRSGSGRRRSTQSRGSSRKSKRSSQTISGVIKPLTIKISDDENEEITEESEEKKSNLVKENMTTTPDLSDEMSTPTPPFQQLRILSLANNKITEEEHLLAVAGWPSLQALVLHGNPLINNCKGEPPLLSHYLRKRLGMSIIRFKPKAPVLKPSLKMPGHQRRKVSSVIPKILKQPVDVMLEALRLPALTHPHMPHPPDVPKMHEPQQIDQPEEDVEDQENIFLTQVQDAQNTQNPVIEKKGKDLMDENHDFQLQNVQNEIQTWQELFEDVKPDPDIHENLPIQGNVKMLHQILQHPAVYTSMDLTPEHRLRRFSYGKKTKNIKQDVRSHEKPDFKANKSRKLQDALSWMREMPPAAVEVSLFDALNDTKYKAHQPEAEELLEEIEKKYRVVREESLRASRQTQRALKETMEHITDLKKNIEK